VSTRTEGKEKVDNHGKEGLLSLKKSEDGGNKKLIGSY
jgi:hypothetical protein